MVSEEYQVHLLTETGGYGYGEGSGWTRGHQIPSADRLDYDANVSTFYMTNMAPQQYDFNSGIWGSLEGRVRTWAGRCDTLYVVTGCDVRNSTGYTGNSGGHRVHIPTHFYKALLRRTKSNTWSAIGFYLPHDKDIASGQYTTYQVSISELEKKTGVTFFVNYASTFGEDAARTLKSNTSTTGW